MADELAHIDTLSIQPARTVQNTALAVARSINNPKFIIDNSGLDFRQDFPNCTLGYYNLIVAENITCEIGEIFLPADVVLTRGTSKSAQGAYAQLTSEDIEKLQSYPLLLANKNNLCSDPLNDCPIRIGNLREVQIERGLVRVNYCCAYSISQCAVLSHSQRFGLQLHQRTNELDYTHWALKSVSLGSALLSSGTYTLVKPPITIDERGK